MLEQIDLPPRHCEERSDGAIHRSTCGAMDCFAPLAMTIQCHQDAVDQRVIDVILGSGEFAADQIM